MKSFMTAKEAKEVSESNRDKKIAHYYENAGKDRFVKKIERAITKAVVNGETTCRVVCWPIPREERDTAIITYFDNLGYDIGSSNGVYSVRFMPMKY